MDNTEKLLDLKEKIDKAKIDKAQAEGRLSELMKRLKTDFDCKDLPTAEKKLKKYEKDIKAMKIELDEGIEALKEVYSDW